MEMFGNSYKISAKMFFGVDESFEVRCESIFEKQYCSYMHYARFISNLKTLLKFNKTLENTN